MMRAGTILTLTAVAMFGLSACNEAKSPETVQKDVASATDKAAENDAKAADKLANADASADKTVGDAQAKVLSFFFRGFAGHFAQIAIYLNGYLGDALFLAASVFFNDVFKQPTQN